MTLVLGLGAMVLGVMEAPNWGWTSTQTIVLLITGVIAITAFIVTELKVDPPLIAVRLFRSGTFSASNLVIFMGEFSKVTIVVFGAIFLQDVTGMSPLQTGVALLAAVVPSLLTSIPAGKLADRFGARWLSLPAVFLNACAMLWIGFTLQDGSYDLLVPAFVVWGAALPFQYAPIRRTIMNAVSADMQGQAGGVNLTAQQLGATTGVTVCGTIYAMTGDFEPLYFTTGGLAIVVVLIGLVALKNPPRSN